jgi:hypothetical protein
MRSKRGADTASSRFIASASFILATLLVAAIFPVAASGASLHPATAFSPITGAGIGASFEMPSGIAVDEASGNIFVTSGRQDNTVHILNFEGGIPFGISSPYGISGFNFANLDNVAVDNSSTSPNEGTLYVADSGHGKLKKFVRNPGTEQYEAAGELTPSPPFTATFEVIGAPQGVAIDKGGNVYVSVPVESDGFGSIIKFSPTGTELARINSVQANQQPTELAVDNAGDLFVKTEGNIQKVFKYPVNGFGELKASNFIELPSSESAQGIGVNLSSNTVFVSVGTPASSKSAIIEYDATSLIEKGSFGAGVIDGAKQIAVNNARGLIYAAQRGEHAHDVVSFGLNGPIVPDAGTIEPSPLKATKATLNGLVGPGGVEITECKFEYSPFSSSTYESSLPCEGAIPADNASHPVTAELSGLSRNTRYRYRVVVSNANGTNRSVDKEFTTEGVAKTTAASEVTLAAATLNGVARPEGAPLGECKFEYGLTTEYGETAPCNLEAGSIPADFEPHSVSASLSGLLVGSTYHYRLVVSGGLGNEAGEDLTFTTLGPSVSSGRFFSVLTETSVRLEALINPRGNATTFHFEYGSQGSCASNPCASIPIPDASAGSVNANNVTCTKDEEERGCIPYVLVFQQVKGLTPGTTYNYRVIVSNSDGTGQGSESTFTTYKPSPSFGPCDNEQFRLGQPSAELPDCRAYEQATPIDKSGNDAGGQLFKVQASPSGNGITSQVKGGGLDGSEGAESYPLYLSQRGAESWSTQGLLPPPSYGDNALVLGWTPDLAYSFSVAKLTGSDVVGSADNALLARSSATHVIQQMTPYVDGAQYAFAGGSSDHSKLFFEATGKGVNLTGNAATGKSNLYLYEPANEELSLVGVLPGAQGGHAPAAGSFAGPFDWWNGTTAETLAAGGALGKINIIAGEIGYYTQEMHAISGDGDKAFFTAGATGQIYLREGLDGESPETVQVSASHRTVPDPNGTKPAIFMAATPDGSKAFFTSCQKLTDDSTAHSTAANTCDTSEQGQDLYVYDTSSHQLRDLTVDVGDPSGADVKGLVGASEDGSYVYFVANGDLDGAGSAEIGNCRRGEGTGLNYSGNCNLYVWHAGSSVFIAKLDGSGNDAISDATNWLPGASQDQLNTARVSADGKTIVFRSNRQLTGYDNRASDGECDHISTAVCPQFYRYQVGDAAPTCVTCNPTGAPPSGRPTLQSIEAGVTLDAHPILSRFVSASGNQVFFETPDKLVGADVNGDNGCPDVIRPFARIPSCRDVYEWEAPGAGSCSAASTAFSSQDGGCLYLLSSGTSPDPSFFGDASVSGNDVFIFTGDQLVPGDEDHLFDVYDVSVDGGLASQNQPPPPSPCEGSACREGMSAPPGGQSAGSASFQGPGDPPVRRRHQKKHHKRHHKPKHHKRQSRKRANAEQGDRK